MLSRRQPIIIIGAGRPLILRPSVWPGTGKPCRLNGGSTELPLFTQPAGKSGPVFAGPDWTRIKAAAIYDWSGQVGDFKLKIRNRVVPRLISGTAVILALDGPTAGRVVCSRSLVSRCRLFPEIGVSLFGPLMQSEPELSETTPLKQSESERTETAPLYRQKPEQTENTRLSGSPSIALLLGQNGMEASLSTALVLRAPLNYGLS